MRVAADEGVMRPRARSAASRRPPPPRRRASGCGPSRPESDYEGSLDFKARRRVPRHAAGQRPRAADGLAARRDVPARARPARLDAAAQLRAGARAAGTRSACSTSSPRCRSSCRPGPEPTQRGALQRTSGGSTPRGGAARRRGVHGHAPRPPAPPPARGRRGRDRRLDRQPPADPPRPLSHEPPARRCCTSSSSTSPARSRSRSPSASNRSISTSSAARCEPAAERGGGTSTARARQSGVIGITPSARCGRVCPQGFRAHREHAAWRRARPTASLNARGWCRAARRRPRVDAIARSASRRPALYVRNFGRRATSAAPALTTWAAAQADGRGAPSRGGRAACSVQRPTPGSGEIRLPGRRSSCCSSACDARASLRMAHRPCCASQIGRHRWRAGRGRPSRQRRNRQPAGDPRCSSTQAGSASGAQRRASRGYAEASTKSGRIILTLTGSAGAGPT